MSWKEISARWQAESPKFFKKVQNIGVSLMAAGGAATAAPVVPNLHVPELITTLGGYALTAGFAIGIVSKLTCADPTQLPNNK